MTSRKIFLELAVLLCLVSLMITIGQGQTIGSARLNSTGFINDPLSTAQLVFQSSFEEPPTIITSGSDRYLGNFPIATYISLQNGGTCWVEDSLSPTAGAPTPRSGRYCIGLQSPAGGGTSLRAELEISHLDGSTGMGGIHGLNMVGKEVYCSVWLYLPSDWAMTGTSSSNWWYEMLNCYCLNAGGYPRICVHIHRPNGVYNLQVEVPSGAGQGPIIGEINPFIVPLGEWFNCRWWFTQSTSGGRFKFWIKTSVYDKMFDSITNYPNGLQTLGTSPTLMTIGKSYMDNPSGAPEHKIWVDDLEVWDGIP